jgi:hypothetical protein
MSAATGHTRWCAGGHRCNLGEHRAEPLSFAVPGAGTAVLTRVRDANGRQYAEVRLRVALPAEDASARIRLAVLFGQLRALLGPQRSRVRSERAGA